jgi:hypothetical protein
MVASMRIKGWIPTVPTVNSVGIDNAGLPEFGGTLRGAREEARRLGKLGSRLAQNLHRQFKWDLILLNLRDFYCRFLTSDVRKRQMTKAEVAKRLGEKTNLSANQSCQSVELVLPAHTYTCVKSAISASSKRQE